MKKILFATTALVATASVAAADVTFSGMGRFGVKTTSASGAATVTDITTRMQLDVKASVELESGMTLGAATRCRYRWRSVEFIQRTDLLNVIRWFDTRCW